MSLPQPSVLKTGPATGAMLHSIDEACPTCDQPIPHDRFDEIKEKIETRRAADAAQIAARLREQSERDKAEAVEVARRETLALADSQVAAARAEERRAAEDRTNLQLAEAAQASQDAQAGMQARIEEAEAAKLAAEQTGSALREQLQQTQRDAEAAVQQVKREAEATAETIRQNARSEAEAAAQEKLAGMERARQDAEQALQARIAEADAAKLAAQKASEEFQRQLAQAQVENKAATERLVKEADARVNAARQETAAAVEEQLHEKVLSAEEAKAEATSKALIAEQRVLTLQATHQAELDQRLQEQREALERDRTDAVNTVKSEAFEEKMKLSDKVTELQRALDKKTAEEHGEGREIDLFEALKSEFADDRIERVGKGRPGADIIHTVIHNGQECGKIIYDSKDHNAWRNDFVAKLTSDKLAAEAEHAILSVRKFPQGTRQLHVHDGVILASPSRVVALVQILRQNVIQSHTLRLSNEARTQKTAALYSFITSEQCADLFKRIDVQTENLLEMKVGEIKYHESLWRKQSEAIRLVQKARADLSNHIEIIIGTADGGRQAINE